MSGSRRKPGPLGPFVAGYRVWLLERGYSPSTAIRSLITSGHLGRWMEREKVTVERLTDERVTAFLAEYRSGHGQLPSSSVWPLLEYLRADGVVPPQAPGLVTPVECLVAEYREWLVRDRGFAQSTIRASESVARRFLSGRVAADDSCGVQRITGGELNRFLLDECARVSVGSAACCTYRLRLLLRYLAVRGLADPGLAEAVPRVARWREATIPRFPARLDIERLLASCDRVSATGARDYAALLLLARLGLRAVEVSRLQLDDLDWRAGNITVDGKAHRRDQLPLPSDVGEAIVAHLRHRASQRRERCVFLTVHAPIRPIEPSGVRTIVRNACRRAQVEHVPAHRLRHALASDLLREGESMIDISQVLRHNQLESTAIYAKVDLERLRLAASPWPGATNDRVHAARRGLPRVAARARFQARRARAPARDVRGAPRRDRAEFVTSEAAVAWAVEPIVAAGSVVPAMRLLVVRGFARYLAGIDPRTEIPPTGLIPLRRHRRVPYIYTELEILTLMHRARSAIRQRLVAATYETLIGLLAATGMRISEAIKLDDANIDWDRGVLLVRESKFNKSRYLPLRPTTLDALGRYQRVRDQLRADPRDRSFFISLCRKRLEDHAVHATFRRLCDATGIGAGAPSRRGSRTSGTPRPSERCSVGIAKVPMSRRGCPRCPPTSDI